MVVKYIINYLLRDNSLSHLVGYCTKDCCDKYKVIIIPSDFFNPDIFGTKKSIPQLPLQQIKGTPVLYGKPLIEKVNDTIVCHSDIIASTFFMISRYEEYLFPESNLDIHGRYIGSTSFAAKANILFRPIVDEYSKFLRDLLKESGVDVPPINAKTNIYLTHDVDTLTLYRRLRGALGGIRRAINGKGPDTITSVFNSIKDIETDPAFTFSDIIEAESRIPDAKKIYFIKAAKKVIGFDYPGYSLNDKDFKYCSSKVLKENTFFGLHTSYQSGANINLVHFEYHKLQNAITEKLRYNRWHYLRIPNATDMNILYENGIEEDFSVCHADIVGYRLGTTRAVNYINPATKEVSELILHPLSIMDATLSNYMNLPFDEALSLCQQTIDIIKYYQGDICLLWHNTSFNPQSYHKELYNKVIDYLL